MLTPLVVNGSLGWMWAPNSPGWLATELGFLEALMVVVVYRLSVLLGSKENYNQIVGCFVNQYEVDLGARSPSYCLWVPVGTTSSLRIRALSNCIEDSRIDARSRPALMGGSLMNLIKAPNRLIYCLFIQILYFVDILIHGSCSY